MSHTEVAVQVLTKARDLVQQGWVQDRAYDTNHTKRCAGQALQDAWQLVSGDRSTAPCPCFACHHSSRESQGFYLASQVFQEVIHHASIPNWNDETGRTQGEVVEAFSQAIARLSHEVVEVPKFSPVPEKIEATWKPIEKITIDAPVEKTYIKKVKELLGV